MLPDEYLAQNVARETSGRDHHLGRPLRGARALQRRRRPRSCAHGHPGIVVLAHPECPPEVVAEADFAGSTAAMTDYVGRERPGRVVLMTECSMSDNVAVSVPGHRLRAALQSLPAHEADHPAEDPPRARDHAARGDDRSRPSPARPAAPSSACWRSETMSHDRDPSPLPDADARAASCAQRCSRISAAPATHHRRDRAAPRCAPRRRWWPASPASSPGSTSPSLAFRLIDPAIEISDRSARRQRASRRATASPSSPVRRAAC